MLDVAIKAAREAGRIASEWYDREKTVSFKEGGEIYTDVDIKVEKKIRSMIQEAFPGHSFIGEEGSAITNDSKYCWIVDPIDGTLNYSRKNGYYGVSIALTYETQVILGVVFNPITNELFTAEKGKGAFLNRKKISVSKTSDLENAIVYVSKLSKSLDVIKKLLGKTRTVRVTGSSAYDICMIACGRIDGFVKWNSSPWGFPAAARIVEEAGGSVKEIKKKSWNSKSENLVLSNKNISKKLLGILE